MLFRITYDGAPAWCAECKQPYTRYSPRGMYCSSACKAKAYRNRKKVSVTENMPKSKQKREPARLPKCVHCGRAFTAKTAKKIYCSDSCKVMGNRAKQEQTLGQLARIYGYTRDQALNMVDDHNWKYCYAILEAKGLIWLPNHELWIPENTKDLWGELPRGRELKNWGK